MVGLEPKLINIISTIKLDMSFDLEKALSRVQKTRNRPKRTKSQKTWYKIFDEMYAERLEKDPNEIHKIYEEVLARKKAWDDLKKKK